MKWPFKRKTNQPRRKMRKLPYDIYQQHIGLVGLGGSGKTVFLTSLIDHIRLDGFKRSGVTLTNFTPHEKNNKIGRPFPYKLYRACIADECTWPAKTGEVLSYGCDFRRSDWSCPIRLHFYDLPGERIADAAMYSRSFSEWSQHTLDALANNAHVACDLSKYVEFCCTVTNTAQDIVKAYKLILGSLVNEYSALITPSTFLLDLDGTMLESAKPEIWAAQRVVGVDANSQFAPLPPEVLKDRPDLAKEFEMAYRSYGKRIVKPVFSRLRKCQQLLVLVDIPGLLSASTYRFNDAVTLIEDMFQSCKPGNPLWVELWDIMMPHRLEKKCIKRLALVATKSDIIQRKDADRLKHLAREMVGRQLNDLKTNRVKSGIFTCASVLCTETGEAEDQLRGYCLFDEEGNNLPSPLRSGANMRSYHVDSLPPSWPKHWKPGDHTFPEVYPLMPVNYGKAPEQEGLWDILSFICGGGPHDN